MITMQMAPTARMIFERIVALKPGENVCILTDTESSQNITQSLAIVAKAMGAEVTLLTMTSRELGGEEPPRVVAAAIAAADVLISNISNSITHTNAQREALKNKTRVCNLREVDDDMMLRGGVTADYGEVKRLTDKLVDLLTKAKRATLTTPEGTNLSFVLEGRRGAGLSGWATHPGEFSGLPDGEAAIAPIEGSTQGIIVNPYVTEKIGFIKEPFKVVVKNGTVSDIEGGTEAMQLKDILEKREALARNCAAEFALGTNPNCRVIPKSREIKKKLGTAHVAIGDNKTLGGNVDASLHVDMIFLRPTVMIDGETILSNGNLLYR
jgi:leucyl aminopeptidase (aminopeptidase T)